MASALVLNHLCFEISQAQDVHNFLFRGELFTYLSTDRLKVIISFCHCCHMILRGKGMWEARNTYNISIDFDVMVYDEWLFVYELKATQVAWQDT